MDIYKLKALLVVFIIYLIAMLPCFIIFLINKSTKNIKNFIKAYSISTIIEVIIFSLIYVFSKNIVGILPISTNIKNYSIYAQKIVFVASIFTLTNYGIPIYLFRNKKKKKAVILFSLKLIYIPILIIMNFVFSTKIALFTIPVLDLIYSLFLFICFKYC